MQFILLQTLFIIAALAPKLLALTMNILELLIYKVLLQWGFCLCPQTIGPYNTLLLWKVSL